MRFVLLLLSLPAFAALPATLAWDVRTTGNDANGGAFAPSATGTDYSQQNSPQVSFTDLVIGVTTTNVTSAAFPFSAASVGNVINITGGSGFTTGRYYVVSVSVVTATLDRVVGTTASTGGVGALGGAMTTIAATVTASTGPNEIYIKAGTYTLTTVVDPSNKSLSFYGYNSTHNDGGTRPLITTATDNTILFKSPGLGFYNSYSNINFSNTASVRAQGITANQGVISVDGAIFDGFSVGVDGGFPSFLHGSYLSNVELKNGTYGARLDGTNIAHVLSIRNSYIHDNTNGVVVSGLSSVQITGTVVAANSGAGITVVGAAGGVGISLYLTQCTIAGNGSDGVLLSSGASRLFESINSIYYGNTGYGLNMVLDATLGNPSDPVVFRTNAFGSNSSGNNSLARVGTGLNPITLSADPFTDSAMGDYSLNSTAGGGTLLKGTGYTGLFSTQSVSVGALQTSGGGGGAAVTLAYPSVQ